MAENAVKSARRVFDILEYFARTRRPARLSEIALDLGFPISSVNVLLKSMVAQGYMSQDEESHRYVPTARIAHLSTWLNVNGYERTVVLEQMYRIRQLAREPVVLGTPEGIYLEYVDTLNGLEEFNPRIKPGTRRLLVQTGTGWLFLARMERGRALEIYRQTIEAGKLSREEFPESAFIERVESHCGTDVSIVHAKELLRPTAHWTSVMISMIIPTPRNHRELAIGVHGPAVRLEGKQGLISLELRGTAAFLAERLPTIGSAAIQAH